MAREDLIEFRRGTAAEWTAANPVLANGEPGFETDTGYMKIGNGVDPWNSLPYVGSSSSPLSAPRENDYIVTVASGTYTATARPSSGLTSYTGTNFTTVLQSAVNALTTGAAGAGTVGSGGGKIHIASGQYTLGNAVTITGWEGSLNGITPFKSELVIEGEGNATEIIQNTAGQHAFIVKNAPQVSLLDMRGQVGSNSLAFLFGDKTGADSESSIVQGTLRLEINSASTSWPAVYLKNFFDLNVEYLEVHNAFNHGIVLENDSTSVYYGNSRFGFLRAHASTGTPYAGLVIRSTNTNPLFGLTFDNYQCISGYYGLYVNGTYGVTFNFVDIESCTYPVYLDGTTGGTKSSFVSVLSGYVFAPSGGTCVYNAAGAFGNSITLHCDPPALGGSNIPLNDQNSTLSPCNTYNLQLLNAAAASAMVFADATKQDLTVSCQDGTYLRRIPAGGTTAGSVVTIDGTQTLSHKTMSSPTFSGLVSGGMNMYGTNEGVAMFNSGATAELAALGSAQASGNWSAIAAANDAVLRASTNNLVITAKNASGAIIFATGATDSEKARISNAGQMTVGGNQVGTWSTTTVTTTTTLGAASGHRYIILLNTGAVVTLPTAVGNNSLYVLKNITAGSLSVSTTSSQTVEGSTLTLAAGASVELVSDGANWRVI